MCRSVNESHYDEKRPYGEHAVNKYSINIFCKIYQRNPNASHLSIFLILKPKGGFYPKAEKESI